MAMYKLTMVILFFVGLFIFSGCIEKSDYVLLETKEELTTVKDISKQSYEYHILPQDRLKISLYRNPELITEAVGGYGDLGQDMQEKGLLVNSQGYITLPLVNRIKVSGLTQTEAATLITQRYKKFLTIPTVYVEVLDKRIYVIGEVKKPGSVKLDREKMTVLEAIAFAGDLTDAAVRDNIVILSRNSRNEPYLRKVDLTKFDTLSFNNMILQPNDVVYVQPDGWKEFRVSSDNFTSPFKTIAEVASPFVTLKYLSQ